MTVSSSAENQSSYNVHGTFTTKTSGGEESLRSDPSCGAAGAEFAGVIGAVVNRFNESVVTAPREDGITLVPAGTPDAPDGGVAVKVCADDKLSAYSYPSTIAVHEGLLRLLKNSAYAAVLNDGDQAGLEARLDEIVAVAMSGGLDDEADRWRVESDAGLMARAGQLLESETAFVLYHELGHSQMDRNLAGAGDSAELRADVFSAGAMSAAGIPMDGVDLVFSVLERVSPEGTAAHPSSGEREWLVTRAGSSGGMAGMIE
ncbi:MAG: hypothetical protein HZB29_09600 [Nitrospinae bacterium]|nr:hypothetical protein [Nitrospinota bacterium]